MKRIPKKFTATRIACLCFAISLVVGCSLHVWPSMTIDARALGNSMISESVLRHWATEPGLLLKKDVEEKLLIQSGGDPLTKDMAKKAGFTCTDDVFSCLYSGSLTYRLHGLPAENASKAHRRMEFKIQVLEVRPPKVSVQVNDHAIP